MPPIHSKEIVVDHTETVCRDCAKVVDAEVVHKEDRLFIRRKCPVHGTSDTPHVFDMPELYQAMKAIFCSDPSRIVYPHDLILYITSKCNMHCPVCYVDTDSPHAKELSLSDIKSILDHYRGCAVHISGGEPTLRDDLFDIIAEIKKRKFFCGLFTNGLRLADTDFTEKLSAAGVDLVILQFDSLNDDDYLSLRGERLLHVKLKALENLKKAGMGTYLFSAIVEGINDDQVPGLVDFARKNIEWVDIMNVNPVWRIGRYNNFERIPASKLYASMEKAGLHFHEFMASTEFSHLCFEIASKLAQQKWVRQPPCAQRLYFVKVDDEVVKLTDILNIPRLLPRLRMISRSMTNRSKFYSWFLFLTCFPYVSFLRDLFASRQLRGFLWGVLKEKIFHHQKKRISASRLLSIMIGAFQGQEDADMRFLKKCTLFANNPDGKGIRCSCTRQMMCDFNLQA